MISLGLPLLFLATPAGFPGQAGGYQEGLWKTEDLAGPPVAQRMSDWNGDGVPEYVVNSQGKDQPPEPILQVVDGHSGEVLWQWFDPQPQEVFEITVLEGQFHANPGVEVLCAVHRNFGFPSELLLFSAQDGSLLWKSWALQHPLRLQALTAVADLDGDHLEDILFLAPFWSGNGAGLGAILGGSGTLLWKIESKRFSRFLYWIFHDIDADGIDEVFLGDPRARIDVWSDYQGMAGQIDPRNGDFLWRLDGDRPGAGMGTHMDFVDFEQDGISEVVVFQDPNITDMRGSVQVLEPHTGLIRWTAMEGVWQSGSVSQGVYADLDHDGILDAVFGSPAALFFTGTGKRRWAGAVRAYSGATGRRMWAIDGDQPRQRLGFELILAESALRLHPDVLIRFEAPIGSTGEIGEGFHRVNGRNGQVLWTHSPDQKGERFTHLVVADLDLDGDDDVLQGARDMEVGGMPRAGAVQVFEGETGSLLNRIAGAEAGENLGATLAWMGHPNGTRPLLAIGAPWHQVATLRGSGHGMVVGVDPLLGTESWRHTGGFDRALIGQHLQVRDLDHDGFPDLLSFGARSPTQWPQFAGMLAVQGRSGELLWDVGFLGEGVAVFEDVDSDLDGDQIADLVVGTRTSVLALSSVVGGFRSGLELSTSELSLSQGGQVELEIDLPGVSASLPYRVLGSLHGTGPTIVDDLEVPLTQDQVLVRSFLGQFPPGFLFGGAGLLDAMGNARAVLRTAPNLLPPALLGKTLHLAVISRGPNGLWEYSTVARPLLFLP